MLRAMLLCMMAVFHSFVSVAQEEEKDIHTLSYTRQPGRQSPDSALQVLRELYNQSLEKKDRSATGSCLQQMGRMCYELGNYVQALDFHQKADKIFREEGMQEKIAGNLADMGILYYYNKQPLLARRQYDEALSTYARTVNIEGLADIYGKIGHLSEKQHNYDSAFYFQRMALAQYSKLARK
ncbi:MAG: hypothetical protein JST39_03540 [Bacteroidetes bacterium]|nr:hypothetical protein [Bacteroidota bacterium]